MNCIPRVVRWCALLFVALLVVGMGWQHPSIAFAKAQPQTTAACCSIVSVNASTGVVTAKVNATGQQFQFTLSNPAQSRTLRAGQAVYANFSTKQISLDGRHIAGQIVNAGVAPGTKGAASTPTQQAVGAATNPADPCCEIAAVDTNTGTVTAKVNTAGRQFQFSLSNPAQLRSLQVGQALYANFASKQVSLDGKTPAGQISSMAPAAQGQTNQGMSNTASAASGSNKGKTPPTTTSTTVNTGDASQIKAAEGDTAMAIRGIAPPPQTAASAQQMAITNPVQMREKLQVRTINQGPKWVLKTFSGNIGGRAFQDEAIYALLGRDGVSAAPIPDAIKNELVKDALAIQGYEPLYIVHKSSAEKMAPVLQAHNTTPSNGVQQTGSSDNGCSWNSHSFGWGEHITETAAIQFSTPGDLFSLTLSDRDSSVYGTLKVKAPMNGSLSSALQIRIYNVACVPVMFEFKKLQINGNASIGSDVSLDAHVGLSKQVRHRFVNVELGGFGFFIGPIPVYIGFDAYVEGRLDLSAPNLVQVTYEATGNGSAGLNFSCGMGGCSGSPTISFSWSNSAGANFLGEGVRAIAKPGVFGGVDGYLETPELFNVHAGVEPYVKGDFWAYSGAGCSVAVAGKNGPGDYAKALTADLDGGLDVLAGIDASGLVQGTPLQFAGGALQKEWILYEWQKHLDFHDLIGSTALRPIIATQAPRSGSNYLVTADMGSCYPYRTEQNNSPVTMMYQLDWGDGSPFSTPQARVGSPASAIHSWSSTGTFPIKVTALRDSHGRQFPQAQVTEVSLQVQNAGTVAVITNPKHQ